MPTTSALCLASALHFVQFIIVVILTASGHTNTGTFPVTRPHLVFTPGPGNTPFQGNYTVTQTTAQLYNFDVRIAIGSFFAMSCLFQALEGVVLLVLPGADERPTLKVSSRLLKLRLDTGAGITEPETASNLVAMARLRLLEYSVSASIMLVTLGHECTVSDIYTDIFIFLCTWACMMFGIFADVVAAIPDLHDPVLSLFGPVWLLPHLMGWLMMFAAWGPIFGMFYTASGPEGHNPPDWVRGLLWGELVVFSSFGAVQFFSLSKWIDAYTTEVVYMVLSITAKTVLAWVILTPAFIK